MAENTHITTVRGNSPTISQGPMAIARALSRRPMKKRKPTLSGSPLASYFWDEKQRLMVQIVSLTNRHTGLMWLNPCEFAGCVGKSAI